MCERERERERALYKMTHEDQCRRSMDEKFWMHKNWSVAAVCCDVLGRNMPSDALIPSLDLHQSHPRTFSLPHTIFPLFSTPLNITPVYHTVQASRIKYSKNVASLEMYLYVYERSNPMRSLSYSCPGIRTEYRDPNRRHNTANPNRHIAS